VEVQVISELAIHLALGLLLLEVVEVVVLVLALAEVLVVA
jgi:hypothetical protein